MLTWIDPVDIGLVELEWIELSKTTKGFKVGTVGTNIIRSKRAKAMIARRIVIINFSSRDDKNMMK